LGAILVPTFWVVYGEIDLAFLLLIVMAKVILFVLKQLAKCGFCFVLFAVSR